MLPFFTAVTSYWQLYIITLTPFWILHIHSSHVFIVGDLYINLLDSISIENDFINNCHSNSLIHLIKNPTLNANNNPSILDHIWSNQLYDTFNGIFFIDVTDHYPIFTIETLNCPPKRIHVKFRDLSGQNISRLKLEVEHYPNNRVQINQDVSSNTSDEGGWIICHFLII